MRGPKRTPAGNTKRANAREAALFNRLGKQVALCTWDYSYDGGAVGTFSFGTSLPAGAVITAAYADEQSAVADATSISLSAGSTSLTAPADFTSTSGVGPLTLLGTAIKVSSESELKMTIATTPATAGKITFCVEFFVSP